MRMGTQNWRHKLREVRQRIVHPFQRLRDSLREAFHTFFSSLLSPINLEHSSRQRQRNKAVSGRPYVKVVSCHQMVIPPVGLNQINIPSKKGSVRITSTRTIQGTDVSDGKRQRPLRVHHREYHMVEPSSDPEIELQGCGFYPSATERNTWNGTIDSSEGRVLAKIKKHGKDYKLFVRNPPAHVFSGPHGACFFPRDEGWCFVHYNTYEDDPVRQIRTAREHLRG